MSHSHTSGQQNKHAPVFSFVHVFEKTLACGRPNTHHARVSPLALSLPPPLGGRSSSMIAARSDCRQTLPAGADPISTTSNTAAVVFSSRNLPTYNRFRTSQIIKQHVSSHQEGRTPAQPNHSTLPVHRSSHSQPCRCIRQSRLSFFCDVRFSILVQVGIVGKYGTRYGASLRKQMKKVEVSQHAKYTCAFCGKVVRPPLLFFCCHSAWLLIHHSLSILYYCC